MTNLHGRMARLNATTTQGERTSLNLITPVNNKIGLAVNGKTYWINTETFVQAVSGIVATQFVDFEMKSEGTSAD